MNIHELKVAYLPIRGNNTIIILYVRAEDKLSITQIHQLYDNNSAYHNLQHFVITSIAVLCGLLFNFMLLIA
jgi:hypothetical protein